MFPHRYALSYWSYRVRWEERVGLEMELWSDWDSSRLAAPPKQTSRINCLQSGKWESALTSSDLVWLGSSLSEGLDLPLVSEIFKEELLLALPPLGICLVRIQERVYLVAAPNLWKSSDPQKDRLALFLLFFCHQVKTFLFKLAFDLWMPW